MKKLAVSVDHIFTTDRLDELLDDILRIFLGVEDVSLVVKDFLHGRERAQDACLIEPIEVKIAIRAYHMYHNIISNWAKTRSLYSLDARRRESKSLHRKLEGLMGKQARNNGPRAMPRIHANAVVSASLKKELDRAKRMYRLALKNYEIKMKQLREEHMRENLVASGCCMQDVVIDEEINIDEEMQCTLVTSSEEDFDAGQSNQDSDDCTWSD